MPLTASSATGDLLDATDCPGEVWATIYKVRAGDRPHCRQCGASMVAKVSKSGLRFFAHLSRPEDCALKGETPEHRDLKRRIAELIRQAGCHAVLEAVPLPGDNGGWRADVLGISPTGRRVAFEVQLAGMTVAEGHERTERYTQDGIAALWLSSRLAHWLGSLPSTRVVLDGESLKADAYLARIRHWPGIGLHWEPAGPVDFAKVVRGVMSGEITTSKAPYYVERVAVRDSYTSHPVVLVSVRDRHRMDADIARRQREAEEEERRARRTKELLARQHRVVPIALRDALSGGHPSHRLWFGLPVRWWNGQLPVPAEAITGDASTAHGAPVFTGESSQQIQLWAVICPVASRIRPSTAWSWRKTGVRVYVETESEAQRVATQLRWPISEVLIARSVSGTGS